MIVTEKLKSVFFAIPIMPFLRTNTFRRHTRSGRANQTCENSLSIAMLRQAATRGRMEATIGADGMWYSSKDALKTYIDSKYKRK
jgi:hypothetical protein